MTDEIFWGNVDEAAENAEQFQDRSYFGKLELTHAYIHWVNKERIETNAEEYNMLSHGDKSIELLFAVDIEELKPDIGFTYDRRLMIGSPDWYKILLPSLKNLLGKDAVGKGNYGNALRQVSGKYVHVKDVPQAKESKDGKIYKTIKFEQLFNNKDECVAAANALFGDDAGVTTTPATTPATPTTATTPTKPEGYQQDVWDVLVEEELKPALLSGSTVAQLADDYKVPVPLIAAIKASLK